MIEVMNIKTQRHLSRLIFRYLQDQLNEEERLELEQWRAASEEHELLFRRLSSSAHWQQSIGRFVKNESDTESEWEIIRQRTVGRDSTGRTIRWYRYAAAVILPLLIVSGIVYKISHVPGENTLVSEPFTPGKFHAVLELADGTSIDLGEAAARKQMRGKHWEVSSDSLKYSEEGGKGSEEYHTLKVPRGGEYTLVLADGSKVFLNAGSSLKYPVLFSGNLRQVKLEGEAYFEVQRNPEKPFVVDINGMQVNVLGTSFGIRAYADEEEIRTTLVSGRVNVSAGKQVYELKPSEQAVYHKRTEAVQVVVVDTELFVGWKDGRLVFDNCSLKRILEDLGRWYSFEVFFATPAAEEIPFSLNIRKHEKFAQVLELMQSTGKIQFEINKNTVIVR